MPEEPKAAFLFDLDGTLVDSVYQHVLAWQGRWTQEGIPLSIWRIHRKIGMSGGLFTKCCCARPDWTSSPARIERLRRAACGGVRRGATEGGPAAAWRA